MSQQSIYGGTILDREQEPLQVWLNKDDEYDSASLSQSCQPIRHPVGGHDKQPHPLIPHDSSPSTAVALRLSPTLSASHRISFVTHLHLEAHGTAGVKPAVRLLLVIQPSD